MSAFTSSQAAVLDAARDTEATFEDSASETSVDSLSTFGLAQENLKPKASHLTDAQQRHLLIGIIDELFEVPASSSQEIADRVRKRGEKLRSAICSVIPPDAWDDADELAEDVRLSTLDDVCPLIQSSFEKSTASNGRAMSLAQRRRAAHSSSEATVVRVDAKYASLVQVSLELCDDSGQCDASQVAIALRARDPDFYTRSGEGGFKELVLQAQAKGAPIRWEEDPWEGQPAVIELTLSRKIRGSFKQARIEHGKTMVSESSLLPTIGSTVVYHNGQGICLPHGNWATPHVGLDGHVGLVPPASATSCPTIYEDDLS